MVMVFHFFQMNPLPSDFPYRVIQKLSIFGQTGVSLFFVLSGFLITRILLNSKDKPKYFSTFYFRRSLRIFPLYYGFLCLSFFVFPVIEGKEIPSFTQQMYHWFYLSNIAETFHWPAAGPLHFWSLAVEEHFYLVWPILVFCFSLKRLEIVVYSTVVTAIVFRIFMLQQGYGVFFFTLTRFDSLAIGALMAVFEANGKLKNCSTAFFLKRLALMVFPVIGLWIFVSGSSNGFVQVIKYLLLAVLYFQVIGALICSKDGSVLNKIFTWRPLLFTGKISYGLYVYHPIVFYFYFLQAGKGSYLIGLLASFLISFLVSSISYYCYESHFLRLKQFFECPRPNTIEK